MNIYDSYTIWAKNIQDPELIKDLKNIQNNKEEITDRFYKNIEFGTAGLRGIMGAGTNRINIYTIRQTSQGFAKYLKEKYSSPSIAISYDSRKNSRKFAIETALVMAANNIKTHITRNLAPTPFLSFATRILNAQGGVMITASHNPCEYNGYKCYDENGSQMTDESSKKVYKQICTTNIFEDVKTMDFKEAQEKGLISFIDNQIYSLYTDYVMSQRINNISFENLKVIYTPLNGAGSNFVQKILRKSELKNLYVVKEQENPDENFTTCPYPNPEITQVFSKAIELANEKKADVILATDPDSDRLGVCIRQNENFKLLTGNEIGIFLYHYIVTQKIKNKKLPPNPVVIKTIVSSPMINEISQKYGCETKEVLTGFKNIASQILSLEQKGNESRYIFGFEESNGYLCGTYVRDKDAVCAALLFCEAIAYYKNNNKTIWEILDDLQKEFGFFGEKTLSFEFKGCSGIKQIQNIMKNFRENPIKHIGNLKLEKTQDYLMSCVTVYPEKTKKSEPLPLSDVLCLHFQNKNRLVIRPSGTEPKIKFYIMAKGITKNDLTNQLKYFENSIREKIDNITKS